MLVAKCLRHLSNSSKSIAARSLTTAAAAASSPSSPVSNSNLLFTSQFELLNSTTQRVELKFLNNQLKFKLFPTKSTLPACSKSLPYIWLRTNCMCPSCYNRAAEECEIDLAKTDLISSQPVEITELTNNSSSRSIRVIWSDGHKSEFELTELTRLITGLQQQTQSFKTLWNHEILERCQGVTRLPYKDYMNDDLILRQALSQVYKYGAVIINQVPANEEEIARVCNRIGPIQTSHFGSKQCVVRANLSFADRAYTRLGLHSHTDNAYLKHAAGLEMFHVIKKPTDGGGKSVLVDGFYCASKLKQIDPSAFDFLTNTHVEMISAKEGVCHFRHSAPVIRLNSRNGEFEQIRLNPYNKVSLTHLSSNEIEFYFNSMRKLVNLVQDKSNEYWMSLNPDEVLIFDNYRMLHGRSAFFNGERVLVTAYCSHDDWMSKARLVGAI